MTEEPPIHNTEPTTTQYVQPDPAAIERVRVTNPDKTIEAIPTPTGNTDITQQTLLAITRNLLPTIAGYEHATSETINNMSVAELQEAVRQVDSQYALRGILLSIGEENVSFTVPPHPYSGKTEPETHSIKSIDHVLQIGDNAATNPDTTFVSGYEVDSSGRFIAGKFVEREIEHSDTEIRRILQHNRDLSTTTLFPAVLVYRRDALQEVPLQTNAGPLVRYQRRFVKPAHEALVGVYVAPRQQ